MIDGVKITPLTQILDDRGKVMHLIRSDSDVFIQFGEVYFACVYRDKVKAWKLHKKMTLNCAVPYGHVKFVLYDERPDSSSAGEIQEVFLGPDHYCLLTVPPMIWTGFQGIGHEMAILVNCASLPYAADEVERRKDDDAVIPYDWMLLNK